MQPTIHENKKNCCEIICKLCVFNCDLTKKEYKKFNKLKSECITLYDQNNEDHEKLLKSILEYNKNKTWRQLGFQSDNPRTDFRAGGFFSLKFIHYISVFCNEEFSEMVDLEYFFFALICIRLSVGLFNISICLDYF